MSKQNLLEKDQQANQEEKNHLLDTDTYRAIMGGLAGGLVALLGAFITGQVSGYEARVLLQGVLPSVRFLSSGVMTAAATILALMLTLLSLSYNMDNSLQSSYYSRVRRIALVDTITLIAAVILLLFISIPLEESDNVPQLWYIISYYLILTFSAGLGGALIATVLMLYAAVRDMIHIIKPDISQGRAISQENE